MVDLSKLKLDKFRHIHVANFPGNIDLGIESTQENVEVIIYYIDKTEDVQRFVQLANASALPKENRTIMVYQKGRKDVNRDSIIGPFKSQKIQGFRLKAPMLCSLSETLSAFVLAKEA